MATNADIKNKLATRAQSSLQGSTSVVELIERMGPAIQRALPRAISPERFTRIALTAVRANPQLQACNHMSFLAALMQSAQLGLEPNTPLGQAYIIPYGTEAQFQIGYQGLLALAYRTGEYKAISAHAVYENDEFEYEYGLHPYIKHKPAKKPQGEPVYYYAVYHLQNGGYGFAVMSREEIEEHRNRYSPSWNKGKSSPWKTNFDDMALKTVLKRALKYAPKTAEIAVAMAADETVKDEIAEDMSMVDNRTLDAEYSVADDVRDLPPNAPDLQQNVGEPEQATLV